MKFLLLLFSVSVLISLGYTYEKECEPDSTWMEDCNTCSCINGGKSCSKKLCRPQAKSLSGRCIPGSRWRQDCNNCFCTPTGVAACTLRGCRPSPRGRNLAIGTNIGKSVSERDCKYTGEGSRWKVNRFWCHCTDTNVVGCARTPIAIDDGKVQCEGKAEWKQNGNWCKCVDSLAVCENAQVDLSSLPTSIECTAGSSWSEGCQTCKCTDGKKSCTKKLCRPSEERKASTCEPGSQWRKKCNVCTCTETGVGMCTLRGCLTASTQGKSLSKTSATVGKDKDCKFTDTPSRWRRGCNWCSCGSNGVGRCELKGCIPGVEIDLPECEGLAEWKQDEQWCKCSEGKAVCNDISADLSSLPVSIECTAGSSWSEGCQTCKCTDGKKSCTKKLCRPSDERKASTCEPGSQWRKECNVCTCTETGVGMCTLRGCLSALPQRKAVDKPIEAPSVDKDCKFTEKPSRWRRDCNWCSCGKNGVGRCELKGCIPGMKIDLPACEGLAEWKQDQQWCKCSKGNAVCNDISVDLSSLPVSIECTDGSSWSEGCQTCKCTDGKKSCTKKLCRPSEQRKASTCEPGSQWRKECNVCTCTETGVGMCTLRGCLSAVPQGKAVEQSSDAASIDKDCKFTDKPSRWRRDCNWCSCGSNGVGRCELKGCIPGVKIDLPECEGPAEWKKNKQWCKCIEGKAVCQHTSGTTVVSLESLPVSVECTEGSSWTESCQVCKCADGKRSCTKNKCRPSQLEKPSTCQPGSQWRKACNVCMCSETGVGRCTLRGCLQTAAPKINTRKSKYDKDCINAGNAPGRWRKNCNWCTCGSNGVGACSLRGCLKPITSLPDCEGAVEWKNGKQWCKCVDGTSSCIDIPVEPASRNALESTLDKECHSGSEESAFKNDCNWCHCIEGGLAVCTKMMCREGRDHVEAEPECRGEISWKRGNIWCTCENDKPVCEATPKAQSVVKIQRSKNLDKECIVGANGGSFMRDCNSCHCIEGGLAVCTKILCRKGRQHEDEEAQCEGEISWKRENEWCTCEKDRAKCEPITEEPAGTTKPPQCTPGETWQQDCNTCSCTDSGLAICTLKACISHQPARTNSDTDLDTRLCIRSELPSRWKEECNWCRCSDTGKDLCTRKLCRPGRHDSSGVECDPYAQWKRNGKWCRCVNKRAECGDHVIITTDGSLNEDIKLKGTECLVGSRWRQGCNWCSCSGNGNTAMCTQMACIPGTERSLSAFDECEDGSEWKNGDKWCQCVEKKAECRSSLKSVLKTTNTRVRSSVQRCEFTVEGDGWKNDCNWCRCSKEEGISFCTRKGCLQKNEQAQEAVECKGTAKWMSDECNWCKCVDGIGSCTNHDCAALTEAAQLPQETECVTETGTGKWRNLCNWCSCRQGKSMCTRKKCTHTASQRIQDEGVCQGDIKWKVDSCNWCYCSKGNAVCQNKRCDASPTSRSSSCSEGATWVELCNTCYCQDGESYCTTDNCNTGSFREVSRISENMLISHVFEVRSLAIRARSAETITCSHGSSWLRDCNWCYCKDGQAACSEQKCDPEFTLSGPFCTDGSEWVDSCHMCTCIDGVSVCTSSTCIATEKRQKVVDPQQQCTENSRWKEDCNWCVCTGGKHICNKLSCVDSITNSAIQCEGNSEWRKDKCTWCVCKNNLAECTRSSECNSDTTSPVPADDPTPHSGDVNSGCTNPTRIRKSCNWCICQAPGTEICTLLECSAPENPPVKDVASSDTPGSPSANDQPEEPSNCREGDTWSEFNDVCTCVSGIIICSRSYLPVLLGRSNECVFQDQSWEEECNTCRCIKGRAACTRKACKSHHLSSSMPELCHLPSVRQSTFKCTGFMKQWTYNVVKGICEQIVYGGCGGTENLFDTESECVSTCGTTGQQRSALPARTSLCEESIEKGSCFNELSRWGFSQEQGKCVHFLYSGCEGNSNNFWTKAQCEETCQVSSTDCEEATCPSDCDTVIRKDRDGCPICVCRPAHCRVDAFGRPHCPSDCAIKIVLDAETGCDKCICNRS